MNTPPVVLLSEPEVLDRLQIELPHFVPAVMGAVHRYNRHFAAYLAQPSRRFRSTALQELVVNELGPVFKERARRVRGRWLAFPATDLVLQVKRIYDDFLPRNFRTTRSRAFDGQQWLADLPAAMRVTLGYRIDDDTSDVLDVRLVAQQGSARLMNHELFQSNPLLPLFHNKPQPTRVRPRIAPKKPKKE